LTYSSQVDQVVAQLLDAGYRRLDTPFKLAGLQFDVAAVLIGTGRASDLVLVEDTVISKVRDIQVRIETIGRAMDSLESKRPITAILIGPRPSAIDLDAMARVSRILPVGASDPSDQTATLRNWLAVLLPLQLPPTGEKLADPMAEINSQVALEDVVVSKLLASAPFGTEAVKQRLYEILEQSLEVSESGGTK
jgi:hypothetical protein